MIPRADHRFWKKVNKDGPLSAVRPDLGQCWLWTGAIISEQKPYGRVRRGPNKGRRFLAHVISYSDAKGAIPNGLELDHLCRIPQCVNPQHLEAVTHKVNTLRGKSPHAKNSKKTVCPQGHAYTPENTKINYRGSRECRICLRITRRNVKRRRRERARNRSANNRNNTNSR